MPKECSVWTKTVRVAKDYNREFDRICPAGATCDRHVCVYKAPIAQIAALKPIDTKKSLAELNAELVSFQLKGDHPNYIP